MHTMERRPQTLKQVNPLLKKQSGSLSLKSKPKHDYVMVYNHEDETTQLPCPPNFEPKPNKLLIFFKLLGFTLKKSLGLWNSLFYAYFSKNSRMKPRCLTKLFSLRSDTLHIIYSLEGKFPNIHILWNLLWTYKNKPGFIWLFFQK